MKCSIRYSPWHPMISIQQMYAYANGPSSLAVVALSVFEEAKRCRELYQKGKLYHRIGNLLPKRGAVPKISQIYFYDSDAQLDYRLLHSGLDPQILKDFQTTLHSVNTYIKSFKTAIEVSAEQSDVRIVLHAEKNTLQNGHARSYNLPTSSEMPLFYQMIPLET
ncbi:retrotransposon-like protein [Elysia marginata]|uniref:Retrotransposon-like protein n=1 Tax=Elysia marginata TaxID=1093978 RepID=A0AAV4FFW4_9GAST|nr:retrotransposon-like protein [Elysia marginata]